jgi:hexosaminidase
MQMKRIPSKMIAAAVAAALTVLPASRVAAQITIVPQPQQVRIQTGKATVPSSPKLYVDKKAKVTSAYLTERFKEYGITPQFVTSAAKADIALSLGKGSGHKEGYKLAIAENGAPTVKAVGDDRNGVLYAVESICQMLKKENGSLTANVCNITDWPKFGWRAYMLDESRHFHGMTMVKRLVNEMLRLKMNTFHWHLVDDPGWRIEIKGYPKLTSEGSLSDYSHWFQGADKWKEAYPTRGRAYYTQEEIKQVVNYCAERGIRVIPEIEVPGHCFAAAHVYPELMAKGDNDTDPAIYDVIAPEFKKFIETTLSQVVKLFPSKIVHIGGDEANYSRWMKNDKIKKFMKEHGLETYPDMQLYTINTLQKFLEKKGVKLIGWNEITGDNVHEEAGRGEGSSVSLDPDALVQFWDGSTELAKKAIKKGFQLVNSNRVYTYLDYPYGAISLEHAYSFNPYFEDLTDEENSRILGVGCQMWGENTPTPERIYFQTFPRIAAYAECGWTKNENKNYADFVRRIAPIENTWKEKGFFTGQPAFSIK